MKCKILSGVPQGSILNCYFLYTLMILMNFLTEGTALKLFAEAYISVHRPIHTGVYCAFSSVQH